VTDGFSRRAQLHEVSYLDIYIFTVTAPISEQPSLQCIKFSFACILIYGLE
jgi:hypothetical protein